MAVNKNNDLPPGSDGAGFIYWAHRGAVTLAESLEEAGRQGEKHVFKLFPKEEGYSMHDVSVSPIEADFFWRWQGVVDHGAFILEPDPNERARSFSFDPAVSDIDLSLLRGREQ